MSDANNLPQNDCLSSSSRSVSSFGEGRVNGSEANLNNYRYDMIVFSIFDPSFFEDDTIEYDYRKPLPIPEKYHELFLRREFSESEKEDIWLGLELLRSLNQLNKHNQVETYVNKALDEGIYVFDVAYTKGDETL